MEWHEFLLQEKSKSLPWSPSFHAHSLELCLNLQGAAEVGDGPERLPRGAWVALLATGESLPAYRTGSGRHSFLSIEMKPSWLRQELGVGRDNLRPEILPWISGGGRPGVVYTGPLQASVEELVRSLEPGRVRGAGRYLWLRARLLEILAHEFFNEGEQEMFCRRSQRLARDRVRLVQAMVEADLVNPPELAELAAAVGCSPFYLSRVFTMETGMTISRFLKTRRLEKAAALLRDGRHNVTEAAMAVGYSSLSHFSKAFASRFGCSPGVYPFAGREN
jgi:AraC-like DNA-binding protein